MDQQEDQTMLDRRQSEASNAGDELEVNGVNKVKGVKRKKIIGMVGAIIVGIIAIAAWQANTPSGSAGIKTLPQDLEATRNYVLDVYQLAYAKALEARETDVIVASEVVIDDLGDLRSLPLGSRPTSENPELFNFRLKFLGNEAEHGVPSETSLNLFLKPLIAWPAWSAEAGTDDLLPVLLVHPGDGYKLGAKAARIRWMSHGEIQRLINHPQGTVDRSAWPYFRTDEVRKKLGDDRHRQKSDS